MTRWNATSCPDTFHERWPTLRGEDLDPGYSREVELVGAEREPATRGAESRSGSGL